MKKFLLFLVIAISAISIGLTIYYFSTDNEVIYIRSSFLVVEKGDTIATDGLLDFRYRDENTTLSFGVSQDEESNVLSYSSGDEYFMANEGGESQIVINTSNRNYPQLVINVLVCDGSEEFPYIITSEEALNRIGRDETNRYMLNSHYQLGSNITLTEKEGGNWTPISNFSGVFDGNYYTISNISITDETIGTTQNSAGFISNLASGGVVKNLFLNNLSINLSNVTNIGGVVGTSNGIVQTVEVSGEIVSTNEDFTYVGGIVGVSSYESEKPVIDRCGFEGKISLIGESGNQMAGGVVGYNRSGNVSECYYRGNETLTLENGTSKFGGIVGINEGNSNTASIYDSYFYLESVVDTTNFTQIGGVVYEDRNQIGSNIVTGNYYGGVFDIVTISNQSSVEGSEISSRTNGYLTQSEFASLKDDGSSEFITYIYSNGDIRTWDFNSVWQMGDSYPLLNIYSAMGSTYPTDFTDIIGDNAILSADELYEALKNPDENASYTIIGQNNGNGYEINFEGLDWKWGDSEHKIPEQFNGTLTCENGCVIRGLKIYSSGVEEGADLEDIGLVKTLGVNAKISGLTFEDVEITGENARYVGLLAGVNDGADIYNISIRNLNVNVDGLAFGSLFGWNEERTDRYIQLVNIRNVDASNSYFAYSGGVVGYNLGSITAQRSSVDFEYNYINNIRLYGNYVGGVAGRNDGDISYIDASEVYFNASKNAARQDAYTSGYDFAVGGIAGLNNGAISEVYSNIYMQAIAGSEYFLTLGGIVGDNAGDITRAYASGNTITVTNSYLVYAGGLVGSNYGGRISRSVVEGGSIITETTVRASSIRDISNCSIVGGLVGFDGNTSSTYSISESASRINSIQGCYAGGLVGIAYGKIERCYVGSQSKQVNIKGYFAGGLCATISGSVVDCYSVCRLSGIYTNETYNDVNSLINMKVSATAGLAVMLLTGGEIKGCYTVAEFVDGGVRFSTCADISSMYNSGKITGCVYTTEGSANMNFYGTLLSYQDLNGGTDSYKKFFDSIGSDDSKVWAAEGGRYPVLYQLDEKLPQPRISE